MAVSLIVPLSKSVHAKLLLEFLVQPAVFVHDYFAVHVVQSGRAYCSVYIAPNTYFHSPEHLLDSVPDVFQLYFRRQIVLYLFVHVLCLVQGVSKVDISSVRLYYFYSVRSYFMGNFGSRCFSSIGWYFCLHPNPLIILYNRVHIVWEAINIT